MTQLRPCILLILLTCFSPAGAAVTYHDPVRAQVLDWSVMLGTRHRYTTPLYLDTPGTYIAELYMEPLGANAATLTAPATLSFTLEISRRGKPLVTRQVTKTITPAAPGVTLFTLESPYDLPEDTDLVVALEFGAVDPAIEQAFRNVRLQLTRKPRFAPVPQWQ
ncbi:MAG: hypothetical protein HY749_10370 [Gammaproteobacteria bacterium]|nr:hypothetical protein [Gammaproteobacteria bacterium]MBI5619026.1 hypothetical protein [Gammaproteobacteria bacterium]